MFFHAFLLCSILVFFISFYGTKEVTFEENLKASHASSSKKKGHHQDLSKKKAKKSKQEATATIAEVAVSFFFFNFFACLHLYSTILVMGSTFLGQAAGQTQIESEKIQKSQEKG